MNADELAAVAVAAALLFADDDRREPRPAPGSRWALAGRVRALEAGRARRLAAARSRWTVSGRARG